ncbi:alpha/beta hydrolase [Sulfitobacter sp.]|uniref:alpha/beta hydrolase n=1 Tax=Sulfitobacter sp. TaxID=1903071 RepID=UPI0030020137
MRTHFLRKITVFALLFVAASCTPPGEESAIIVEEPVIIGEVILELPVEPVYEVIVEPTLDDATPDEILTGDLSPEEASVGIVIEDDKQKVQVFYGTNRVLRKNNRATSKIKSRYPERVYGDTPDILRYGKAQIIIPPQHERGTLETPLFGKANNEKRYVVLKQFEQTNYKTVMSEVQQELKDAEARGDQKTLIAYVHGFNTSFEKAARRAGQLKYDLDFAGPFFFFSWPSKDSAFGYTHASNLAEISYTQMTQFLKHLTEQDADRIIIIAHSMGTRVFSHGLVDLAAQDPEAARKITKVILAAPDIDAIVFKERLLPKMSFLKNPITLYASSNDIALLASKEVNGLPRIGDVSGRIQPLPNVVTIDASDVDSNLLNHTYFGDSVSIVDDFKDIVNGPLAAEFRPLLRPVRKFKGKVWRIRSAN